MKSSEVITLTLPLRNVRLVTKSGTAAPEPDAAQAAYENGKRDAEKAMGEQLLQQRAELLELHQGVITSLRNALPQLVKESENALIELTLQAAQRIVAEIPITRELVEVVIRDAIKQVEDSSEITIQLHPDDLALLRKQNSPILEGLPETGPLRYSASSEVSRGGCMIHTRFGLIDARRETKIEQLRQSLAA